MRRTAWLPHSPHDWYLSPREYRLWLHLSAVKRCNHWVDERWCRFDMELLNSRGSVDLTVRKQAYH